MKATIKDIAKKAEVSTGTVSMALNNKRGINEDTKKRVLQIAKMLNYTPNLSARSLVTKNSYCIGLTVPQVINPFFAAVVDEINREAEKAGYSVLLGITNNNMKREKEYIDLFLGRNAQGVIVVPSIVENPETSHLLKLRQARIPFVFCTDIYAGYHESCVMTDLEKGEYEIVKYLISCGMKKIAFLSSSMSYLFVRLRYQGFKRAMDEAGMAIDESLMFAVKDLNFDAAYAVADDIIDQQPDVIVVINDIMAMGVIKRMQERGVRVPADISVVGYDDMMFSLLAQTPISTVAQPIYEICKKTLNILIDKMNGCEMEDTLIFLDTELKIRESVLSIHA